MTDNIFRQHPAGDTFSLGGDLFGDHGRPESHRSTVSHQVDEQGVVFKEVDSSTGHQLHKLVAARPFWTGCHGARSHCNRQAAAIDRVAAAGLVAICHDVECAVLVKGDAVIFGHLHLKLLHWVGEGYPLPGSDHKGGQIDLLGFSDRLLSWRCGRFRRLRFFSWLGRNFFCACVLRCHGWFRNGRGLRHRCGFRGLILASCEQ